MPTPPVTTGLVQCLQADSYTGLADNTTVGNWADGSGAGNIATRFNAPKWRTARTPAGSAAVQFLGGSGGGYFTIPANTMWVGATAADVFLVVRGTAANNPGVIQLGPQSPFFPHPSGVGGNSIFDGSFVTAAQVRSNFANPGVSNWGLFHISHNGTVKTFRWNDAVIHTETVGFTPPAAIGYLGFFGGATSKWTGDVAEILAYTRVLDATEKAATVAWLQGRHLTISVAGPTARLRLHGRAAVATTPMRVTGPTARLLRLWARTAAGFPGSVTTTRPGPGAVVPALRPRFAVTVRTRSTAVLSVQVQYDTLTEAPVTLTAALTVVGSMGLVVLRPDAAFSPGVEYLWHARLLVDGVPQPWTADRVLTVDPAAGDTSVDATWVLTDTVDTGPHLWWVSPDAAGPGDLVTVVGTGLFGAALPDATVAGVAATVTAHTALSGADPYGPGRRIDPAGGTTVGREQLTVVVPDVPAPGGPLIVDTGS